MAPNATVMRWRGVNGGIEAAKQDHDVVMTPGDYCYFDHYQGDRQTEPLAIGGFTPVEKVILMILFLQGFLKPKQNIFSVPRGMCGLIHRYT